MVNLPAANAESTLYDSPRGRLHGLVIPALAIAVLIGNVYLPTLSIEQQFWIALVPIAVVGLSHGGADPAILKKLAALRAPGVALLLTGYVSAAAGFVALIWFFPVLALCVFLALSIWHFGYTDEAFLIATRDFRLRWLSGSTPILGPLIGHPEQTSELFAWLVEANPDTVFKLVVWVAPMLGVIWLLVFASLTISCARQRQFRAIVELPLVAGALIALPPLLGFAFYFSLVHTVRHFLAIAEFQLMADRSRALMTNIRQKIVPATCGALVLGLAAWAILVLMAPSTDWLVEAVRVMFWALAALTFPHAVIVRLWWNGATGRLQSRRTDGNERF